MLLLFINERHQSRLGEGKYCHFDQFELTHAVEAQPIAIGIVESPGSPGPIETVDHLPVFVIAGHPMMWTRIEKQNSHWRLTG
jgi:hypothetical protein